MKRCVFFLLLPCLLATGGDAFGDIHKPASRRKRETVPSAAGTFGRKVGNAFRSVGGHLQKFFTGRDTITR